MKQIISIGAAALALALTALAGGQEAPQSPECDAVCVVQLREKIIELEDQNRSLREQLRVGIKTPWISIGIEVWFTPSGYEIWQDTPEDGWRRIDQVVFATRDPWYHQRTGYTTPLWSYATHHVDLRFFK